MKNSSYVFLVNKSNQLTYLDGLCHPIMAFRVSTAHPNDAFCETLKYRSRTLSDPFVKLSDVERKPPDILSDLSETEVYCLSDPSVLVSDRPVALSDVN